MDDDDNGLPQPSPEGLFDHEAIAAIMEKAKDALRPLGLTLQLEGVAIQVQQGHVYALMPCIVRPSAKQKLTEDRQSMEEFSKMMAANNELKLQEETDRIRQLAGDPKALEAFLFEGIDSPAETACQHVNKHPEGFCLDCGHGL